MSYLALFFFVAVSWCGVPATGGAALGAAAVLASQGELDIVAVLVVSSIAGAIGGIGGYHVGRHLGRSVKARGATDTRRARAMDKGEEVYAHWGRIAVFFTPCWVAGAMEMPFRQFVPWNALAATVWTLGAGLAAYGVGTLASSDHPSHGILPLVIGLAVIGVFAALLWRRARRRRALAPL